MKLTNEDGKDLIKLAREAVSAVLEDRDIEADKALKSRFSEKQGVFVTLHLKGDLRGCIGFTEAIYPLWGAVVNAAKAAAFEDPRFPPLAKDEFPNIKIEVSVLTVPELIKGSKDSYVEQIEIGKHGLIVDTPMAKGLLLPQVFTEYNVDSAKALEMTCQKAGLAPGSWKDKDCRVYRFLCQIFSES